MKKVLLIVDDPEMWEFMSFYLAMQGCKVYRSNKPDEFNEMCRNINPHLVVIDSSAARLTDVPSLYNSLAPAASFESVKFLVLTNPADYELMAPMQRPQDTFITRPVRPKMLLIIIRGLIDNERPEWTRMLKMRQQS